MKKLMRRVVGVLQKPLAPIIQLIKTFAKRKPILFTLLLLVLLLLLIAASEYARRNSTSTQTSSKPTKKVAMFTVGEIPRISVLGEVTKENVVTLAAQTGGIISSVHVKAGDFVAANQTIATIGSDYQGNVAASVQKSLAGTNYNHLAKTYKDQKEIIAKQKEIAHLSEENSSRLRDIQQDSLSSINEQVSLSESILDDINDSISNLEVMPSSSASANTLQAAKSSKAQLLAGLEQLRSSQRQISYQTEDENPPAKIGELTRDITIKQLDLSEKALDLTKQTAALQVRLAQIAENASRPVAPFAGVIEEVYIRPGMMVSPGTPVALLKGKNNAIKVTVHVPVKYATQLNLVESTYAIIDNKQVALPLPYIPQEVGANGQLSIQFQLGSTELAVSNRERLSVSLPLGNKSASSVFPLIPMEAVYLGAQEATVLIVQDGKAITQPVVVGNLLGDYVSIVSGLKPNDQIIINRTIVNGEQVEVMP
jgi:multidrug efflux pump subunit AcrA (membrane-fusion protein)